MSVRIHQLSKIYGTQKAVDAISFEAKKGEVLGFLGPNGAGKSTTMKIATGYLPPSEGTVELCGIDVMKDSVKARKKVGYLPEHNPLYLEMYVHEYLHFMAGLHGIKGNAAKERIVEMVALCGLTREQHKKIGALSKGYRQRVGLAQALLHDPEVLILDEPTTGLDPNQLVDIRQLIKTISKDKTVILSTHIMQEVKAICDRVVIINQGKLVANDLLANMTANKTTLKVEFQEAVDEAELKTFGAVTKSDQVYHISTTAKEDLRPKLFDLAKQNNWTILSLSQEQQDLEEIFHQLTQAK
ncbi:gliding motility-associated ABC transporter ATP-binding subunit GldA [Roseivirga pacifica]|uniref:gliding motility-associated ABC transporter ATP-binding subunit GldA n=1 Tax=Roseivirga pacifica TaxID=1267423 RepID=UPI00209618BB|nr:gliding motility-associated ABC transporter ATP-binding subunit GldA [Roseivirga pacifica]MCO6358296.1 gliding motility-associated ABC transporter ATP-binding subunit GldA [Roseivirga pacifica]MCO6366240.1 gliding motility-associated ABC transporter ATP-binding subunit GldA [Roseivirga pacifica]MCO6369209.1 gliding motility-associated ABC transporter ATP-binding subunit GldA [Roseivirga pacifica]MCO6374027.1 gliding motility-associated ABC transporter ATP-binding subunit GldA [Roseivirga pac